MAAWTLPTEVSSWIGRMASLLHRRSAWRMPPLFVGALFGQGRRTVASWLRGEDLGVDFRAYYYFLGSLGRNVKSPAWMLLRIAIDVVAPSDRLMFAFDDRPTKRYGHFVEGTGTHHNPTPGPADQKFLYGHVWGTMS